MNASDQYDMQRQYIMLIDVFHVADKIHASQNIALLFCTNFVIRFYTEIIIGTHILQ